MPIKVEMPRLSDTMQAGTVVKWNVKEGQKVKSGDVLADIETDKATMELQSFDDGTVASVAVPEGQSVPIGTVILVLAAQGEDLAVAKAASGGAVAPAAKAAAASQQTAAPVATAAPVGAKVEIAASNGHAAEAPASGRIFVSPLARKIAQESGVDLAALSGTGPGGRIVRADVEAALRGAPAVNESPAAAQPAPARPALSPAATTLQARNVSLSNMRRIIATRLVESKQTIPHYQVTIEVDMDPLLTLRKQLNEQLESQGVKLSVNDFLVRACALGMHNHPFINSRWNTNGPSIDLVADVNIGIAIALSEEKGGGLVVATLRNADQIGLRSISSQSKQLAEKARGKGRSPQELSDSPFTISNLGMFGVSHFSAIINPPNAAILAVGAAIERPVVKNGQIVVGHVMSMTLACDHRIVDGAMAAQYLATVKSLLEKPATLLV